MNALSLSHAPPPSPERPLDQVPGEILDRPAKHLSPAQIVELARVAGCWKLYNTVHDSLRIPVAALLPDTSYVKLV